MPGGWNGKYFFVKIGKFEIPEFATENRALLHVCIVSSKHEEG